MNDDAGLTCYVCGQRAGEDSPAPRPCSLPDEAAALVAWGFGTHRRPRRACPAGRTYALAAFLAGRNERRAELRAERRAR